MNMPHFQIEGHVYFITSVVYNRLPLFTRSTYVTRLIDSLNFYRYQLPFRLLGFVIMPDHVHLLIWPEGTASVSDFMRDFKRFTARRLIIQATVESSPWAVAFQHAGQATGRSDRKVWQDGYWDQNVYSSTFMHQKLHYIHRNPVRAGLVEAPGDYPYSSFRNYMLDDESLIEIDRGWG